VTAGGAFDTRVIVRNHAATPRPAEVRLRVPAGWSASPAEADVIVPADAAASIDFEVRIPAGARSGRVVITADVTLGGDPRGELAESLVEFLHS
jgi:hypothetical protein